MGTSTRGVRASLLATALAMALAGSLAGCGNSAQPDTASTDTMQTGGWVPTDTAPPTDTQAAAATTPDATGTFTTDDGDEVTVAATFGTPGPATALVPSLETDCGDIDAATMQRTLALPITFDVTLTTPLPLQFTLMASPTESLDGDLRTYAVGASGNMTCGFSTSHSATWSLAPGAAEQMTFYWFDTDAVTVKNPTGDDTALRKAKVTPIGLVDSRPVPNKWTGTAVLCPGGRDLALKPSC